MTTVAYLANRFPAAVEPYVGDEIRELEQRGVSVIAGSVRKPDAARRESEREVLCVEPIRILTLLRSVVLMVSRWDRISCLITHVLSQGKESPMRRLKALLHTWLGACYAVQLRSRGVDHIHVHHGYFGSWIAMVAARLLGATFSLTLHGSDLLLDGNYLETKLKHCNFCATISEYNRRYILDHFAAFDADKIIVSRLGVDVPEERFLCSLPPANGVRRSFFILAVGRLHAVKNHAFLIRACGRLRDDRLDFKCAIAGEGPERQSLELLIQKNRLHNHIALLGHVARPHMDSLYRKADLVVLTSHSEGLPLVLMEAMARSKVVLAPAITGIPEIVVGGKTGFLYAPGEMDDFVARILFIEQLMRRQNGAVTRLEWIQHAARVQVIRNFSREPNLTYFSNQFLKLTASDRRSPHEDLVLQQI